LCVKIGIKGSPIVDKSNDLVAKYLEELESQFLYIVSIMNLIDYIGYNLINEIACAIGVNIYEVPCAISVTLT